VRREVGVLPSAFRLFTLRAREGRTHGKSIKVGPPPDRQAFGDLPITPGWLGISALAVGDTETFIESGEETFLIGLAWIEVSSGTGISHGHEDSERTYSL
jgi:hypothetical protein